MQYKRQVLKRVPEAVAVVLIHWSDGSPRRVVVFRGDEPMTTGGADDIQGHRAAWRDAYAWCMRNKIPVTGSLAAPALAERF